MWCVPVPIILQLGRLRQEDGKLETSMGYVRPYLKVTKQKSLRGGWKPVRRYRQAGVMGGTGALHQSLHSGAALTCRNPFHIGGTRNNTK